MLPHQLLELPVDQLAVDYAVAKMAVEAEIKALKEAGKGKKKKPKTSEDFKANVRALEQLNRFQ